jgi:hypothetical protein
MIVRKIINSVSTSSSTSGLDPYFDNVVLMFNCDGTNGSTSFSDLSLVPKSITVNNATVSTATKKFGTGSMVCTPGVSVPSGSYLKAAYSPDFNFRSGDFTVECWAYFNAIAAFQGVFSVNINSGTTYGSLRLETQNGSSNFYVLVRNSGGSNWISTSGYGTYSAGSWIHLAVVRYGTQITLYCNGVGYPCFTISGAIDDQQGPAYFGWSNNGSFNGFVDDCRITKGLARYTANFTPPTAALPTASSVVPPTVDPLWSSVLLALTGDGSNGSTSITDISTYARTVTLSGNTQVNTSKKIAGTGSIYLDGVGDYLTIPTNSSLYFGTSDFTIELWFNQTSRVAGFPNYPSLFSTSSVIGWAAGSIDLFVQAAGGGSGFNFYSYNINPGSGSVVASTTNIVNNVWYHVAVSRSGSTFRMFVNGVQESTFTSSTSIDSAGQPWTIGVRQTSNGDYINGYIDNFRVTKGTARYTANFTPPTYQLPVS